MRSTYNQLPKEDSMKHNQFHCVVVIPLLLTAPAWAGQCQVVAVC